jgi:conjugative transfer signal peptidase TraF
MKMPNHSRKDAKRSLAIALIAITAIAVPAFMTLPKLLIWNASASVPIGLYAVLPNARLRVGNLAVSSVPTEMQALAATRRYLPANVPLIKPVSAIAGTTVCRNAAQITIAGVLSAEAKSFDAIHRPMPLWRGCRRIASDEIFLMNPAVGDSFDGRYFGPTPISLVRGRAYPLLILHHQND